MNDGTERKKNVYELTLINSYQVSKFLKKKGDLLVFLENLFWHSVWRIFFSKLYEKTPFSEKLHEQKVKEVKGFKKLHIENILFQ